MFSSQVTIFFHEDDFCQVEMSPIENENLIRKEFETIKGLSAGTDTRYGFDKIYVRGEPKTPLSDRQIDKDDLDSILISYKLQRADKVLTGYGSTYCVMANHSYAFGDAADGICYKVHGHTVTHIWLLGHLSATPGATRKVLEMLGKRYNLVLVDWNQSRLISY